MTTTLVITAVAPARGLTPGKSGDTVTLDIEDDGSRGPARAVLLVPVDEVGTQLRVLIDGKLVPPPFNPGQLRGAAHWKTLSGQQSPYKVSSQRSDWIKTHQAPWPFDTKLVLVLLLYYQSPGIGIQGLLESLGDSEPWPEAALAVNRCLDQPSAGPLRRGLVDGFDVSP